MFAFFVSPKAIVAIVGGLLLSIWVGIEVSRWWLIVLLPLTFWTAVLLQIKSLKVQWQAAKDTAKQPRKFIENKAYDRLPIHQKLLIKWLDKRRKDQG